MNGFFTLLLNKRPPTRARTPPLSPKRSQCEMEDFIERTLRERRTLQQALVDLMEKYNRVAPGDNRSALARMIEGLRAEIALQGERIAN